MYIYWNIIIWILYRFKVATVEINKRDNNLQKYENDLSRDVYHD